MSKGQGGSSPQDFEQLFDQYWYYTMEMARGVWSPGTRQYANIALTRQLLSGVDVTGARCLDIGTMEGLVPVLLKRRGAASVTAIDGQDCTDKIDAVKRAFGVDFDYVPGIDMATFPGFLERQKARLLEQDPSAEYGYDVVVLSGVLYHVYSPMQVLAVARSALRQGGIMVVETGANFSRSFDMKYNFDGQKYIGDWTNCWYVSVGLLDHMMRFFKLQPLECNHLRMPRLRHHVKRMPRVTRVGVTCRAIPEILVGKGETLMRESTKHFGYRASFDEGLVTRKDTSLVPYHNTCGDMVMRKDTGSCDLYASVKKAPPHRPTENETRLTHDAMA